ncbi:MAG: PTS sugar transporter subunit IIC [Tissierellia bacterium]|nr:PTS sugar transporter subunit IIC [Tissierellia bacterium]
MKSFLKKKEIYLSPRIYFIDVLGSMAFGLFASLLVGTILNTLGQVLDLPFLSEYLWPMARDATGAAIGVAIAYALKAPPLVLFSAAVVGTAGNALGGPVGTLISVLISTEIGKAISGETKIDILVTPCTTIAIGGVIANYIGPPLNHFMTFLGEVIMAATNLQPLFMGIIVSVIVGITLTLPISSAALCMMLSLSGRAGGAATAGCCAQMVGFAYMSWHDNGLKGVSAVGLGTSMLQMSNIMKNPWCWLPPTIAAAITGPISTLVFKMENTPLGSGMGTCGLVGQIETFRQMAKIQSTQNIAISILILHIFAPIIISAIVTSLLRKKGLIQKGDLTLEY